MGELKFTYGVMGAAKTAQALMLKYSLETDKFNVLLLKPAADTRDGACTIKSRAGLEAEALTYQDDTSLKELVAKQKKKPDMIIVDEVQFSTAKQIEELKEISVLSNTNIYTYGLLSDFKTRMFPASQRLVELADKLDEIEMLCSCGKHKASVSARFDKNGQVVTDGNIIELGGNDKYKAMCFDCWLKAIAEKKNIKGKVSNDDKTKNHCQELYKPLPIFKQTDKAVAFFIPRDVGDKQKHQLQWLPKSQIEMKGETVTAVTTLASRDIPYLETSINLNKQSLKQQQKVKINEDIDEDVMTM